MMNAETITMLQQKVNYYSKMANMCERILNGEKMFTVCVENDMSITNFRAKILRKDTNEISFNFQDILDMLEDSFSGSEKLLQDLVSYLSRDYKSLVTFCFAEDLDETVEDVISELPKENMKKVLNLYYFEEKSKTEIAKMMHLSITRVTQILNGALRLLRRPDRFARLICGDKLFYQYASSEKSGYFSQIISRVTWAFNYHNDPEVICDKIMEKVSEFKQNYLEEQERKSRISDNIPLESLGLDARIYNTIACNTDIHTINALLETSDEDLLKIPNFGKGSLNNVKKCLAEKGYI